MKVITVEFGSWFAGFTDGEGSFQIIKRNRRSPCANYECRFSIQLRDDDRPILDEIRNTLGFGTTRDKPFYPGATCNARPLAEFYVCAVKDCAKLAMMFETYPLRAKKRHDFEVWKQAVAELTKPADCRDPLMLDYYFHHIKEVRQYDEQEALVKPITINLQLTIDFNELEASGENGLNIRPPVGQPFPIDPEVKKS